MNFNDLWDIKYWTIFLLGILLLVPLVWYINYLITYKYSSLYKSDKDGVYALQHLGIIMDGNRRWSKKQHKNYREGYIIGGKKFIETLIVCLEERVPVVTFYALSRDNFEQRTIEEIHELIEAVLTLLQEKKNWFIKQRIAIKVYGERSIYELKNDARDIIRLEAQKLMQEIDAICAETQVNHLLVCNLLVGYHPIDDVLTGMIEIAKKIKSGEIDENNITRDTLMSHIQTHAIPPLDLVIRTGGVSRLSGFVPMQSLYAEIEIFPEMWPGVSPEHIRKLIRSFGLRTRNFGR